MTTSGGFTDELWSDAQAGAGSALLAKVVGLGVAPTWVDGGDRLWLTLTGPEGLSHFLVDAATGEREPAFDAEALAKSLSDLGVEGVHPTALVLSDVSAEGTRRTFTLAGQGFACEADGSDLTRIAALSADLVPSPSGSQAVLARDHDLWVRDLATGTERRLTRNGLPGFEHGHTGLDMQPAQSRRSGAARTPGGVIWSPDERYVLSLRFDLRLVPTRAVVNEFAPPDSHFTITTMAPLHVAGDYLTVPAELSVIDLSTGSVTVTEVTHEHLNDYAVQHLGGGVLWWDLPNDRLFLESARFLGDTYGLLELSLGSGAVRQVYEETEDFYYTHNQHDYHRPNLHVSPETDRFIWYSQRSGWGHLHLHDLSTGAEVRPLTSGDWVVRDLLRVDDDWAYFTAAGREEGRHPYYRHLYRVPLSGGEPQLLTPEDADHEFGNMNLPAQYKLPTPASVSPNGKHVVDTYSTVSQPPVTVLRRNDGSTVAELARADASALEATGWTPPRQITTVAADGTTVLHGVMYTPRDLDESKKYAVIDQTYPGPQAPWVPVTFVDGFACAAVRNGQMFADLGFVVVAFDGRGCSGRDKAFRYAFAGTEDVFGAADHVAGITHLAEQYPYLDLTRVGITGGSYGGYGSTRALLLFPEFFTAAVSTVGPTDYRALMSSVSTERFFQHTTDRAEADAYYELTSNARLAERLTGKLLLIHGELDHVPLNSAITMYAALQEAGKDYESLIMANADHAMAGASDYTTRQTARFFLRHLGDPTA